MPGIICVMPTVRPECHAQFVKAWTPLFEKHQVTLITVWDGETPLIEFGGRKHTGLDLGLSVSDGTLFCRRTDACRNLGFVAAARMNPDYVLTMDDDCYPLRFDTSPVEWRESYPDPIQSHLDVLQKQVPISWMSTAHDTDLVPRGVPYGVRDEAPVMLSHGVWVGTPDFDGETQLNLEQGATGREPGVPYSLPYFVGPIPKGVLFPLCGMNVMVRKEALPHLYFAPMGPDCGVGAEVWGKQPGSGVPLNRFADIWMGVFLKRAFDRLGWACYTGASTILHTRASDARKNFEQEKLGREWNEASFTGEIPGYRGPVEGNQEFYRYFESYANKRRRYADLITKLLGGGS